MDTGGQTSGVGDPDGAREQGTDQERHPSSDGLLDGLLVGSAFPAEASSLPWHAVANKQSATIAVAARQNLDSATRLTPSQAFVKVKPIQSALELMVKHS